MGADAGPGTKNPAIESEPSMAPVVGTPSRQSGRLVRNRSPVELEK